MTPDTLDRAWLSGRVQGGLPPGPALAAEPVGRALPAQWTHAQTLRRPLRSGAGVLTLRIDADQPPWLPEDESCGCPTSKPAPSPAQSAPPRAHRHRTDFAVETAQPTRRLYTPSTGIVEASLRASPDPTCMLAVWLVGFEEAAPEQSGEICIAELYGHALGPRRFDGAHRGQGPPRPATTRGHGRRRARLDATDWHTYAAAWTAEEDPLLRGRRLVRTVAQGLHYPLQLMVDLFEFPADRFVPSPAAYPRDRGDRFCPRLP